VIIRTAESFLRFGHFELLAAQKETETLKKLLNFTITNYFPEITSDGEEKYQEFFKAVCTKTADLMVEWYRVGFVHGVMNTDNMSILSLTIDYGPYSMLDEYDLNFTPNTTDLPGRRYAFGKQGQIAQWNLWQLANSLFQVIEDEQFLEKTLNEFGTYFWKKHDEMLCRKFGFENMLSGDDDFFSQWQSLMQKLSLDYTLFFNHLENYSGQKFTAEQLQKISYAQIRDKQLNKFNDFLSEYEKRRSENIFSAEEAKKLMRENNPRFILRNYFLYQCIEELEEGKTDLLEKLVAALKNPYEEIFPEFSVKRPDGFEGVAGCSMLSCSS